MSLLLLQTTDPFSEKYIFPPVKNARELTRLLLARQRKIFNQTICEVNIELTEKIIQRNFNLLLKKYSIQLILRGIEHASLIGDHPFSTKFVEDQIEYYLYLKT